MSEKGGPPLAQGAYDMPPPAYTTGGQPPYPPQPQQPQQPYQPYVPAPPTQPGCPPQQGYPPAGVYVADPSYATTTTTVIMGGAGVRLSPNPMNMQCPHCSAPIVSEVNYVPGALTWILCIVMLLLGLFCGCCLIPFCVPECQNVEHRCPNCKQFLGVYRRL